MFKNIAFTAAQFIFGFYCNWSGQTIYDDYYITLYNVLFTAFTISYLGSMDQDIRYRTYLSKKKIKVKESYENIYVNSLGELPASDIESMIPMKEVKVNKLVKNHFQHFYYMTQKGIFFNYSVFSYEALSGTINASVITVATIYFYADHIIDKSGYNSDFWMVSFVLYTTLILATNLLTFIRASHITWLLAFAVFLTSLLPFFLFAFFYDRWVSLNTQSSYSARFVMDKWHFYSVVLLSTIFICFVEIVKFFGKFYFNPTIVEYVRQLENKGLEGEKKYYGEEYLKVIKRRNLKKKKRKKGADGENEDVLTSNFIRVLTRGEY